MKGHYIGECTILIFDLIETTEKENIPGIMLLLDLEKALHMMDWTFLLKTLDFFFLENFATWEKSFPLTRQVAFLVMVTVQNFLTLLDDIFILICNDLFITQNEKCTSLFHICDHLGRVMTIALLASIADVSLIPG